MKENLKSNNIAISEKEFAEMFRELSAPIYTTFVAQEEKAIAEVAIKNEIHEEEIEKLSDSFWWVSLGWENIIPRNSGYYEMKVKELIEQKNAEEIIAEIEKRPKENRQKRKEILQKYDLGGEIKRLLEVFDKFAYFHDLRKEIQMRAMFAFNLLLSEVARRFKLKDDEKELYTRKEILNMLKGEKVDAEEIKRRKRAVFLVVERDGVRMLSGDEAITAREAELKQETKRVDQFRGIVAMKGKVTARVKVCNGVNDAIEKLKSGEILAVGMTTPDYAPVMRIAGAIITNEGGITCHAAIVSRELGIPCIVGTKIATQVLKDGDLVEVDADNGVVRIIEKS
ncbi:MAG: hypothetical protein HGA61_03605 [Candidatus Moranbacteria bacterium]|nr:hypothetical protein [Candidatus Moranbacteria bacterium]